MLSIDTNLLRAVTKYDPAGRLRPGHASPAVTQPGSMWRFLAIKFNWARRLLTPPSIEVGSDITSEPVKPT